MLDDQISANYFFLKKLPNLPVFRVERHGSATIYWTSRMALLRYLQNLQDALVVPCERPNNDYQDPLATGQEQWQGGGVRHGYSYLEHNGGTLYHATLSRPRSSGKGWHDSLRRMGSQFWRSGHGFGTYPLWCWLPDAYALC
jgi:hypothetical protein